MKACVATGEKRRVEYVEIPTPVLRPGTLLLKTRYACICGSDLEYLDGSFSLFWQGVTHPGAVMGHKAAAQLGLNAENFQSRQSIPVIRPGSIPGHEFVAEVVGVGEGVNAWKVGDRVAPGRGIPGVAQPIIQPPIQTAGYETYRAFAEYMLVSPTSVQKVPDNVTDEAAALVEPLSTGIGSVLGSGLAPGKSAVIIGAGKIGLLAMLSARVAGAAPVIVTDLVQSRLDKALGLGADAVIDASKTDVIGEVARITEDGANAVIVCVRDGRVLNEAVEMGCRGATIVLAGYVPPSQVNPMLWGYKQLRIVGVLGGPAGSQDVMALAMYLIAHKQIDPRPIITETISLAECQRAIDSVYNSKNIAVLLKP